MKPRDANVNYAVKFSIFETKTSFEIENGLCIYNIDDDNDAGWFVQHFIGIQASVVCLRLDLHCWLNLHQIQSKLKQSKVKHGHVKMWNVLRFHCFHDHYFHSMHFQCCNESVRWLRFSDNGQSGHKPTTATKIGYNNNDVFNSIFKHLANKTKKPARERDSECTHKKRHSWTEEQSRMRRKWKIEFYLRRRAYRTLNTHWNVKKNHRTYLFSFSTQCTLCDKRALLRSEQSKWESGHRAKEKKIQCVSFSNKKKTDFLSIHLLLLCASFSFESHSLRRGSNAAPMATHTHLYVDARSFLLFPCGKQSHIERQKAAIMCLFRPFWSHTHYTHSA